MPFRKVQSGQQFDMTADEFNSFVDASEAHRRTVLSPRVITTPEIQPPTILVRNDSGNDAGGEPIIVPRFGILGLASPLILPTENLPEFQNRLAFSGVAPKVGEHDDAFVILAEPLSAGAIGRGFLTGSAPVVLKIEDEDHTHATIQDEGVKYLVSTGDEGKNRILWKPAGTGFKWAYVAMGEGGGARRAIRLRVQSMGPDHLVCLDDDDNEVLVARQWLIRRTPFDGQTRDGISYVYTHDDRRIATTGEEPDEETEVQEIIQRFVLGDEIWAEEPETTGVEVDGEPVVLLMQSDGRAFAKVPE